MPQVRGLPLDANLGQAVLLGTSPFKSGSVARAACKGGHMKKLRMLEETLSTAAEDYGIDWSIETDVAHECLWGMEVRITHEPNTKEAPDISTVLFISGSQDPEDCARRILPFVREQLKKIASRD